MNPNTAATATPTAPSPSGDAPAPTPPASVADPNALGTELSEAEENALIDRSFGITDPGLPLKSDGEGHEGSGDNKETPKPGDGEGSEPAKVEPAAPGTPATETPPAEEPKPETPPAQPEKSTSPEAVDTSDLWVELEDANGKTFKIGVGDPIPEDLVFKNDAQLAELTEARMEMKGTLKERQAEFEQAQADAEEETNSAKSEQEQYAAWDNEIQDLIGAGLIEPPKAKPGDKDFLQDPSVQKIDTIFKFMSSENTKRAAEGKPMIISFGTAYTLWSNDAAKKAAEEELKKDNEIAKARGSLVGGSSSSSSGGNVIKGLYQQGSAGTIHDVSFDDLLDE